MSRDLVPPYSPLVTEFTGSPNKEKYQLGSDAGPFGVFLFVVLEGAAATRLGRTWLIAAIE